MRTIRKVLIGAFLCSVAVAASANSVNTIAITGSVTDGFAITAGDFTIDGTGLHLVQSLPDGPSTITSCTVGAVCSFTWGPTDSASFCHYCTAYSGGTVGSSVAQYLSPNLTFKGSAFYSGGDTLNMNFTVTGTITGYGLINCTDGADCSLGPQEFTVYISGHGTEQLQGYNDGQNPFPFAGLSGTFTGTATTAPEPASMVLLGTGLAGVVIKRKRRL